MGPDADSTSEQPPYPAHVSDHGYCGLVPGPTDSGMALSWTRPRGTGGTSHAHGTWRDNPAVLGVAGPGPGPDRRARRLDRHGCGLAGDAAGDARAGGARRPRRVRPDARRSSRWGAVRGR